MHTYIHRNGKILAKEIALPITTAPTATEIHIANRSKQNNLLSLCNSYLERDISAIVYPRTMALAAIVSQDLEEGIKYFII